jgi:hypothetical protein
MPRRPVPATETRAQKFERLANLRTNLIQDGLRKLGSLSNRNHYDYTEDEVERIFSTGEGAVADAKNRFLGRFVAQASADFAVIDCGPIRLLVSISRRSPP